MRPSPSIVPADRPSRRLSQPLYDRAPFQISGLTRAGGFAASASPMTWRYSTFGLKPFCAGLLQPPR